MRWDTEKLPKLDSHVYGENGAKFMVYNMKRNPKRGKKRKKQKQEKRKFKKDNSKRKNFIPLITLF